MRAAPPRERPDRAPHSEPDKLATSSVIQCKSIGLHTNPHRGSCSSFIEVAIATNPLSRDSGLVAIATSIKLLHEPRCGFVCSPMDLHCITEEVASLSGSLCGALSGRSLGGAALMLAHLRNRTCGGNRTRTPIRVVVLLKWQ